MQRKGEEGLEVTESEPLDAAPTEPVVSKPKKEPIKFDQFKTQDVIIDIDLIKFPPHPLRDILKDHLVDLHVKLI